jgi:hypothetical protein
MAKVKEIQICGGKICDRLYGACGEYIKAIDNGTDREKLHFDILLDNGQTKSITLRQMEDGVHVYGDFEGMPNALEWVRTVMRWF